MKTWLTQQDKNSKMGKQNSPFSPRSWEKRKRTVSTEKIVVFNVKLSEKDQLMKTPPPPSPFILLLLFVLREKNCLSSGVYQMVKIKKTEWGNSNCVHVYNRVVWVIPLNTFNVNISLWSYLVVGSHTPHSENARVMENKATDWNWFQMDGFQFTGKHLVFVLCLLCLVFIDFTLLICMWNGSKQMRWQQQCDTSNFLSILYGLHRITKYRIR